MRNREEWSVYDELSKHKRLFLYTSAVALLCSLIVSFSIPKQYVSRVILTPESKFMELEFDVPGGMFSKFLKDESVWITNAPDMYIQLLRSNDFRNKVKQIRVKTLNGDFEGTYEEYLKTKMQYPWFYNLFIDKTIDDIVDDNVKYNLNLRNAVITIQVSSCDAYLSATMPDMIKDILSDKIKERYTNLYKNRSKDIAQSLELAENDYQNKISIYAHYVETHENSINTSEQLKETQHKNAVNEAFAVYEQFKNMKKRFDMLVAKDDIYLTTLVKASVAREATNPHYIANALIWLFYSFVFTTLFILYRKKIRVLKRKEQTIDE